MPLWCGVLGAARDLTSAWLPRSSRLGEEPISSCFPLPAGTVTMKVKEVERGEAWLLGPLGPVALGKPPPTPRPKLRSLFRGSDEVVPEAPGSEGLGICSCCRAGSGTFLRRLLSAPNPGLRAPPPSTPQPPTPPTCAWRKAEGLGTRDPCASPGFPGPAPPTSSRASPRTLSEAFEARAGTSSPASKGPWEMEQGLDGVKCCTRASGAGAAHRLPAGPAPRPVTHPGLRAPSRWPPKASWPWREAGGQRGEGTASRSPGPTEPVVGGQGQGVPGPDGSPGPGELGVWGWRVWGRLAGSWGRGWGRGAGAKAGTAGSGGGAGLRGGGGTFLGGGGRGRGPM